MTSKNWLGVVTGLQKRGGRGEVRVAVKEKHKAYRLLHLDWCQCFWFQWCAFARCYLWRKLAKGHTESFCIISYNCMRICNYLKIKILVKEIIFLALENDCYTFRKICLTSKLPLVLEFLYFTSFCLHKCYQTCGVVYITYTCQSYLKNERKKER